MSSRTKRIWIARDGYAGEYGMWETEPKMADDGVSFYGHGFICGEFCATYFHVLLGVRLRKGQKRQYDWIRNGTTIELREVK